MRTMFREFLHHFGKVDCEEKVPPREFGEHVNFLVGHRPIGQDGGPHNTAPWRAEHGVLHTARLGILRKMKEAISKEAYR
jgi:hypothetical protein